MRQYLELRKTGSFPSLWSPGGVGMRDRCSLRALKKGEVGWGEEIWLYHEQMITLYYLALSLVQAVSDQFPDMFFN